ncbi:MAG: phosphate regulon transcriptional regulatory protein PhoB [Gammaproteobacteria bacterium TMED30]|nr:MAG: phosphate regulon transcriptional regulatory protein PhoB [Gammaproteobacteria bacterium TMED30]
MSPLILIVEDEPPLVEMLKYNFESAGFRTSVATDGQEALFQAEELTPDLILLDWMLPEYSGIEICRKLRDRDATKSVPIIMLTARSEEDDRILGLNSGADDYVVKPFSPKELVARVQATLRRSQPGFAEDKLVYADLTMDLDAHKVFRSEMPIHLGPTEYRLLQVFMQRPTRVFSREQLLDRVWGRDIYVEERTVDVHIRRLRKALNENDRPDIIRTVRGGGYSLDETK